MAKNYGVNQNTAYGNYMTKRDADMRREMWKNVVRGVAVMAAPVAASAIAGGGAAGIGGLPAGMAPGGASIGGSVAAPIVASGGGAGVGVGAATASRMPLYTGLASKGVDTLFGIYANRQQGKSNREALAYQQAHDAEAMAYEREQMAEQKRQFNAQQLAAKAQWDATQKFETDRFAASEDERLHTRQLADERETRRAPYRAASAAALARIPDILASGRTSPGLGSLGSFRRS